ncbi:hypothetical protein H8N03_09350 [Ramlibacter sp. USB13]|uniref:Uncharacterized protein n=1 Tax=Ramlibacter cellulosilyticus TaxID=2764187 RepID=A0A923SEP5_9BURK|nr:hypothetical protein [Ramlibacter cellulosilyticus]MBC5783147.1 hypothetical protein [Ramlibacter cellulosilyticus]
MSDNPAAADPVTVALTGMFPAMVLLAALLSYPVARWLLALYHRSVGRGMQASSGASAQHAAQVPGRPPATPLRIVDIPAAPGGGSDLAWLLEAPRRAGYVYAAAGAVYALVMAVGWLVASGIGLSVTRVAAIGWTYFWPTVLGVSLVATVERSKWRLVGAYAAALAVLTLVAYAVSPDLHWHEMPVFWLLENAVPTLLLAAFLSRRIRAVGPMVLAFMVLALIGSQLPPLFLADDASIRALAAAGGALGLGGVETFWAMLLAGAGAFGVVGWWLLRWLGRRYEQKRITDHMLVTDALWLLFGITHSYTLAFHGWPWVFTGLLAFACFRLTRALGFRWLRARPHPARRTLLLLRVFALGPRSARLFDVLQTHWLRLGDITMIAGPDLVTTTVEPHEFLAFLGGKLSRQFVEGRADLDQRLARLDTERDVDGRYRVNEFFCRADTWQMAMRELAARSDAVLMDLRSFSPANRGCLFELGELLQGVDLERVVFVVDASTDRAFLEASLAELWTHVTPQSPNRRRGEACARIFDLAVRPTATRWHALLAALAGRRGETEPRPRGTMAETEPSGAAP